MPPCEKICCCPAKTAAYRTLALVDRAYWPNATEYMRRPGRKVSAPAMSKVALVGAERGRKLGI